MSDQEPPKIPHSAGSKRRWTIWYHSPNEKRSYAESEQKWTEAFTFETKEDAENYLITQALQGSMMMSDGSLIGTVIEADLPAGIPTWPDASPPPAVIITRTEIDKTNGQRNNT